MDKRKISKELHIIKNILKDRLGENDSDRIEAEKALVAISDETIRPTKVSPIVDDWITQNVKNYSKWSHSTHQRVSIHEALVIQLNEIFDEEVTQMFHHNNNKSTKEDLKLHKWMQGDIDKYYSCLEAVMNVNYEVKR